MITTRNIYSDFKSGSGYLSGGGLDWLSGSYTYNQLSNNSGGLKDQRFDLGMLSTVVMNSPTWYGAYLKILGLIEDLGQIYEVKKDGKLVVTDDSLAYTELLDEAGHKRINQLMAIAAFGLGLGGGVAYKSKEKGKLKINFDPYTLDGFPRVVFFGDRNNQLLEVEILNNQAQNIYDRRIPVKDIYHYQFSNPNGTSTFGTNGVVVAAKWMKLEYAMMTANDQSFSSGLHINKIASLDSISMTKTGANRMEIENATQLLVERMKQANGVQNAGKMMVLPFPMNFTDISSNNNSQMRTTEFLEKIIPQNILKAMGLDTSILGIQDLKYRTSDLAVDLLYQSIKPFTNQVETLHNKFTLPILQSLDTGISSRKQFVYRMKRNVTQEEIQIKDAKNKEIQVFFQNLKVANETFGGMNIVALPNADRLKYLEEQGMVFKTRNVEEINIKPSTENQTADFFTNESVEETVRQLNQTEIDEVYSKYQSTVNMSASELEAWSNNECSKNASLDRSPIERNLKLLRTPKAQWGQVEVTNANKTISFVSRMKSAEQGEATKTDSGKACPSKRDISLKNWAFDPNKGNRDFDYYQELKLRLDTSFSKLFNNA